MTRSPEPTGELTYAGGLVPRGAAPVLSLGSWGDDDVVVISPAALPSGGRPRDFTMYRQGGRDSIAGTLAACGWASYESPLPEVFAACVAQGAGVVVDVGCNTGFYSLLAMAVRPDVHVHAFEPYAPVAAMCLANVAASGWADRITLQPHALGRRSGSATLYVPADTHGTVETSASLSTTFRPVHSERVDVPTISLDAYVQRSGCAPVDVIKIDVETAEHRVLAGAADVIARDRPVLFCEVLAEGPHRELDRLRRRYGMIDVRLRPGEYVLGEAVTFDPDACNHMLVPVEQVAQTVTLLESLSLGASVT